MRKKIFQIAIINLICIIVLSVIIILARESLKPNFDLQEGDNITVLQG